MSRPVVFCDVDGTLCFHREAHGIRRLSDAAAEVALVEDPTGHRTTAHVVSTSLYEAYLGTETRDAAHRLREHVDFVLVTGARRSTWEQRKHTLDFARFVVLENGGLILDVDGNADEAWSATLGGREPLRALAAELRADGWVLDDQGRTSALRIRREDNTERDETSWRRIEDRLAGTTFRITRNLGHLDVLLEGAGKDRAVAHLLRCHADEWSSSHGVGDDVNDIDFLRLLDQPCALGGSVPELLEAARQERWRVTAHSHFRGIESFLTGLEAGDH